MKKVYCKNCVNWSCLLTPTYCKAVVEETIDEGAEKAFGGRLNRGSRRGDFKTLNKNNDCEFYKNRADYEKEELNEKPKSWSWWDRLMLKIGL